ncbi:hypothetical protein ACPPVV_17670 [Rhodanobacter sp. Col0626]|uniref:hypothetical protein n=1 Tax=Rhodanobacter sp. Col0626 TaxID=3415679 RepID=UPI003CEBAA47
MRIFNSTSGDPMLLDTAQGLRSLQDAFGAFLSSPHSAASFEAATRGSPAPYDEFLLGLRVSKGGTAQLQLAKDGWLELSGAHEDLLAFHQLLAPAAGDHLHWYCQPVSLIIEADDTGPGMRANSSFEADGYAAAQLKR